MSRRRSRPRPAAVLGAVGGTALLVLVGATLQSASTAGLTGLPRTSVRSAPHPLPSYAVSAPAYIGTVTWTGSTITVTPSPGSPPANDVKIKYAVTGQTRVWETCTRGAGTTWTCPLNPNVVAGSVNSVATVAVP